MELTPQFVDVLLLIRHLNEFHEMISHSRMRTVCANEKVEVNFNVVAFRRVGLGAILEPG
jgi:hypothetical protein